MIDVNKLDDEQKQSYEKLKKYFKESRFIYTKLNHVSHSGMFRLISVYAIVDNEPLCLDYWISNLGIQTRDKRREGLRVSGCGMDMGFHVVDNVFSALFGYKYNWQSEHSQRWL